MFRTHVALSFAFLCASPALLFAVNVPAVGKKAPEFTLQSQEGGTVSLRDYQGKWVVLYFYPFPGRCALETDNFARDQAEYEKKNTVVLGVSVDVVGSQKHCQQERPNFKLLADTEGNVSREYGSLTNLVVVKLESRNTFIIDPQGRIAEVFTDVAEPAQHSHQVLEALTALQQRWHPPAADQ
jgi:peroxiredoxin Q/BCP